MQELFPLGLAGILQKLERGEALQPVGSEGGKTRTEGTVSRSK
jgi:hypothetical protein